MTPRGLPFASMIAHIGVPDAPTAMPTRSAPVGASSFTAAVLSRAMDTPPASRPILAFGTTPAHVASVCLLIGRVSTTRVRPMASMIHDSNPAAASLRGLP